MQSTTYGYSPALQSLLRRISYKRRQTGSLCSLGPWIARLRRKGPRKRYPKSPPKRYPKSPPKRYPKSPPKRYPKRVCLLKLIQNERPAQHMKISDFRSSRGYLFPTLFHNLFHNPFHHPFHHPFHNPFVGPSNLGPSWGSLGSPWVCLLELLRNRPRSPQPCFGTLHTQ